ncbi:Rubredoxin-oxygen oxidoreductase [Aedoeadaptatus nemausensis]|uniref:Rubredoxin-oxygen oxidoreductase n=1 Tax=Aedoeadaptatus nemausensis TaxID=2582829 RepID=A0A6V6Y4B8_9FIRM|nr:FprA family A-type flavoprotein [Peptoniphilus nemausensis]CAC9931993.1 Rubredoxin-oxygen oxidoreductase [Peptoniphilus nemausensis]
MGNLRIVKINDHLHYIGVNDRYTHLFEAMWPLPDGISYNSYLFDGGSKTCLIDCVRIDSVREFMDNISEVLDGRPLDYVVVNHMEPDHTSSLKSVVERFPEIKIITNKKAVKMMSNFYNIGEENVVLVEDGETVEIGERKLTFYTTPMVHWPESMVCFEEETGILFSQDAFGGFGTLDGAIFDDQLDWEVYREETIRYYTNIVGKYSVQVIRALKKLEGLDIKMICPDHGPVWRENIGRIVGLYSDLSEQKTEDGVLIVYGSMYGNSEFVAESIARALADEGVRNIRIRDISKTHLSYLISETWNYKGIILGCPTYNVGLFPPMENLVEVLKKQKMKNHVLGTFTNYTWGGGAEKKFAEFAEQSKWEVLPTTVDVMGLPGDEDFEKCRQMAKEMAEALKK